MPIVLVDAGPLVALIDRTDPYHQRCTAALANLRDPLATVWPAFTEAMYLLRFDAQDQRTLWDMVIIGGVGFLEVGPDDCPRMRELMWKYRDLPMDLADAALVVSQSATIFGASLLLTARTSRFIDHIASADLKSFPNLTLR